MTVSNVLSLHDTPFADYYQKEGDHASGSGSRAAKKPHMDTPESEESDNSGDEDRYAGTDGEKEDSESDNEIESEREERVKPRTKKTTDSDVKVKSKVKDLKSRDGVAEKNKKVKETMKEGKGKGKVKVKEATERRPAKHPKNGLKIRPRNSDNKGSDLESDVDSVMLSISNHPLTKKAPRSN